MNTEIRRLAREIRLESDALFRLRLAFGVDCVRRVEQFLIDEDIIQAFMVGKQFVAGQCSLIELNAAAKQAHKIAASHAGTSGLDGAGNAAVSVSNAASLALAGRAIDAAEYSAYAKVYAYSSHAVTDPKAYTEENNWQLNRLRKLATDAKLIA